MKSLLKKLFPSKEERARLAEEKQKLQEQQIITIFERDGKIQLGAEVPSGKNYIGLIEKDEFEDEISIKFLRVAGYASGTLSFYADEGYFPLYLALERTNNNDYIIFQIYQKLARIKIGDKLSFLLDSKEILDFEIKEKAFRVDKDDEGVIIQANVSINHSAILKLQNTPVRKIRYHNSSKSRNFDFTLLESSGSIANSSNDSICEMAIAFLNFKERFIKE